MPGQTFGERLKALREKAGLTQPELAARAGMNRFGIAKLEQGVREPTWATVQALARALGVGCSAFEGAGDPAAADVPEGPPPTEGPAPKKPARKKKE